MGYSKFPLRKHIYQGQTILRAYELLTSQLTHGVRLKPHKGFEKMGKTKLILKAKKQEIQAQLLRRLCKACRNLSPFTRAALPPSLLSFFFSFFPYLLVAGHSSRHCNEAGISSTIKAEHNHRL